MYELQRSGVQYPVLPAAIRREVENLHAWRFLQPPGVTNPRLHLTTPVVWIIVLPMTIEGCGSPVVKVLDHGRHVMSSSPVPLKSRRVGQGCTLNLSRAETSSRWYGVVVRRGGASSGVVDFT
ncbi:uncharacterized protein TNCV_833051 [Trichonephila clavipes]|uniref:Uncharacterized protein n=1 Tax=Trichonephila clavipes TaxID=2585209 RepID=A0A8X6R6Z2_TRICX|nr:uncharacterized protein TNCV_833051 [Trichonephila clavipes]